MWGIFPYIADYRVTASLDLYEYTGIGLDINFKTEQANNYLLYPTGGGSGTSISQYKRSKKLANDVENIISELEDMMENGSEYISDKAPFPLIWADRMMTWRPTPEAVIRFLWQNPGRALCGPVRG